MRCHVPFCRNTFTSEDKGTGISFHNFPSEVHLRAAWLKALGRQDSHLTDSAVVCSQHFLNEDIYETDSGSRQIASGAVPSTVKVCMICLDTDSKMCLISKHNLQESYETLTGHPLCDQGNLKQTLCFQCSQKLINFSKFRDKSLRARTLIMDLVEKHDLITRQHLRMLNHTKHQLKNNMVLTKLEPNHCDLHIVEHTPEDTQIKLEELGPRAEVKIERNDNSMSLEDDTEVINEYSSNSTHYGRYPLKYECDPLKCSLCSEEFFHEHEYMQHMTLHLQVGDVDGQCDLSQVCEPHSAVNSSSSHSSLVTENKQDIPKLYEVRSSSAHFAHISVAPLHTGRAANNVIKVTSSDEADTMDTWRYNRITDYLVKLNDSSDGQNIVSRDISYQATDPGEVPKTEYDVPLTNRSRLNVCKTFQRFQHKPDYSNNYFKIQYSSKYDLNTEETRFICDICQKTYKRKSLLVAHIRCHTGDKPLSCKICEYKCAQTSKLVAHMRTHTGEKPFSCKLCDYKCAQSYQLKGHMITHTGEKPFSCNLCDYKCAQTSKLVTHMRTHTGEKPFSCKLCDYKCAQSYHLMGHMRTHTGEKPFSCDLCNHKCAHKSQLVTHMRSHTGEKPFSCKLCDYRCSQSGRLVTHMRTHTGEKPFSCNICDFKCSYNANLLLHIKTHSGEKPFLCKICQYKCARKYHLLAHMRTHTGEKPFLCKICDYKCVKKGNLVRHMKTHAGE